MDPHEVAPILGMSANGVAALSYRAREGLRKAWLQAHVSEPGTSEDCKWTMSRLGDHARHSLTAREQEKINAHLLTCTKCAIVSEEVDEVGSHLAMVMLPIVLGAGVGGALLATLGHASAATAATAAASALPAVPASFTVLAAPAAFAPAVTAGLSMGAATGVSALVGTLAIAAALGGGVAIGISSPSHTDVGSSASTSTSASALPLNPGAITTLISPSVTSSANGDGGLLGTGLLNGTGLLGTGLLGGSDGSGVDGVLSGVTGTVDGVTNALGNTVSGLTGGVTTGIVDPLLGSLTPGASPTGQAAPGGAPVTTNITLTGSGTPGATVAAQVGGIVYGTATVNSSGNFTLLVTALPSDAGTLQLSQTLTLLGISLPINIPLSLNTGSLGGLVVQLLN
jgi:hypothetical protein